MKEHLAGRYYWSDEMVITDMGVFLETKMRASIPQRSKDSSIAGGSVWTERETMLKIKSVLALANNRIMIMLKTFRPTLVYN